MKFLVSLKIMAHFRCDHLPDSKLQVVTAEGYQFVDAKGYPNRTESDSWRKIRNPGLNCCFESMLVYQDTFVIGGIDQAMTEKFKLHAVPVRKFRWPGVIILGKGC